MPEDTAFYVSCTGQITSGQFGPNDGLYCRYVFSYGPDWTVMSGIDSGLSQTGRLNPLHVDDGVVWNFPIDITFKSTNVHGWPRIAISVYGVDFLGRDVVRGYSSALIPLSPGQHIITTPCYTPLSSSIFNQWSTWILGNPPEFYDSKLVCQGEGREVTRVQNTGSVDLVLNVSMKGMESAGYSMQDGNRAFRMGFKCEVIAIRIHGKLFVEMLPAVGGLDKTYMDVQRTTLQQLYN